MPDLDPRGTGVSGTARWPLVNISPRVSEPTSCEVRR